MDICSEVISNLPNLLDLGEFLVDVGRVLRGSESEIKDEED